MFYGTHEMMRVSVSRVILDKTICAILQVDSYVYGIVIIDKLTF